MSDLEFLTGICQSILNPFSPTTDEEKEEVLAYERDMEYDAAMYPWPPEPEPDWSMEL